MLKCELGSFVNIRWKSDPFSWNKTFIKLLGLTSLNFNFQAPCKSAFKKQRIFTLN